MTRSFPLPPGAFHAESLMVDGAPHVQARGELDLHTGPALWAAARPAIDHLPPGGTLVLDLRALAFIDVAGIGTVVRLGNELDASGKRLEVRAECPTVRRVFEITHLEAMLSTPVVTS